MSPFFYPRDGTRPYGADTVIAASLREQEPDMRTITFVVLALSGVLLAISHARFADAAEEDEIIALERKALDRWGRGDPTGFLEIYAREITYFDVGTERRLDGHAALTDYYRPLTGKIKIPRYEMIGPKVQRHGDVAVLTYNLRSEGVQPDGKQITVRWNSSSVYARMGREWKVIHSHWSLTAHPCARGTL
jgi:ketosteroid isomerase-like protein